MLWRKRRMLVLCLTLGVVHALDRTLNVDELKLLHYDVQLAPDDPVPTPNPEEEGEWVSGRVVLSSAGGQRFACQVPDAATLVSSGRAAEDEAAARNFATANVTDNLSTAFQLDPRCLTKTVGWWTYEFCYGKIIKQYHMEGDKIMGDVISLGEYTSDKEWEENDIAQMLKSQKFRYHVQNFTGGSVCDLTHQPRRTQVQFFCDEELSASEAYILDVEESSSCVYVLRVQMGSLCTIPLFRSLEKPQAPANITCHPLLTREEFLLYQEMKRLEAVEAEKEAERVRILSQRMATEERLRKEEAAREQELERREMEKYYQDELLATHRNLAEIIVDTYFQYWSDWDADSVHGYEGELTEAGLEMKGYEWAYGVGVDSSIWQWPPDVIDNWLRIRFERNPEAWQTFRRIFRRYFFQHSGFFNIRRHWSIWYAWRCLEKVEALQKWPSTLRTDPETFIRSVLVRGLQLIRDDQDTIPPQPDAHQFANIFNILFSSFGLPIKEAENDLYTVDELRERELLVEVHGEARLIEMDAINRKVFEAEWQNELLAEQVVRHINSPIQDRVDLSASFADIFEDLASEAENELEEAGEIDIGTKLDRKQGFKALAETLNKILSKVEAVERNTASNRAHSKPAPNPFLNLKKKKRKDEDEDVPSHSGRVTVKDLKGLKLGGVEVEAMEGGESALAEALERKTKEMQSELAKTLQKAGIDTAGRKVEVKVVTAGIFQNENGQTSLQILDGSSQELSNMLMAILGGDTPEAKEEKRYSTLETGYNFNVHKALKSKTGSPEKEHDSTP